MSSVSVLHTPTPHRWKDRLQALSQWELGFENTRPVRLARRMVNRLSTPLGALFFALAIGLVCGVLVHERCLVISMGIAAVIVSGWYLPGLLANNAQVRSHFDTQRVTEGETAVVHIQVRPREALPLIGLVLDTGLPVSTFAESWKVALPAQLPWRRNRSRWAARWEAPRRGLYRCDRMAVTCSFPFRLREARVKASSDDYLIVQPRIYRIPQWPAANIGFDDHGLTSSPAKGSSGDTMGLRDYRIGDDPRRIHWPQTARLGHLVVREQHRTTNPRMTIHLEAPERYRGWELDWAVRLAASFLAGAERLGWRCDIKLGDEESPAMRRFLDRDLNFHLDRLAAYGTDDSLATMDSDAASAEVPRDQLQLRIISAGSASRWPATAQEFIALGEWSNEFDHSVRPWLHFEDEADILAWLGTTEEDR